MANKHPDLVYDTVEERAESIAAAEARGEARGRAAVLAEVAGFDPRVERLFVDNCYFCGSLVRNGELAHESDCLWARAHAAGVAAPEER
jgi:hypothetical protein